MPTRKRSHKMLLQLLAAGDNLYITTTELPANALTCKPQRKGKHCKGAPAPTHIKVAPKATRMQPRRVSRDNACESNDPQLEPNSLWKQNRHTHARTERKSTDRQATNTQVNTNMANNLSQTSP